MLDVDAEGYSFPEGILIRNGTELIAEVAAVKYGYIKVNDIVEEG